MAKFGVAVGMFGVHHYFGGDSRGYLEAAKLADAAGIDHEDADREDQRE